MPCYSPLQAWKSRDVNPGGKRSLVFKKEQGLDGSELEVACGQCIGCRLEKSRQWAMRCVHEASLYEDNCFLTLTYNDDNLPSDWSLDKKHFQDFMKRLRKRIEPRKVRYFHCGEYGEENGRPHYHACLFNWEPPDKELWSVRDGVKLYRSAMLEELWTFGHSTIGEVTFESAAYVARYVMKKVTGAKADEHYKFIDNDTGELYSVIPEYTTMSRRPGIGKGWFDKYHSDCFPSDSVIIRGKEVQPPKYYESLYEKIDPEALDMVKSARLEAVAKVDDKEKGLFRLRVKEDVKKAQIKMLKRGIE